MLNINNFEGFNCMKITEVAAPRCEISNQILKELIDLKDMFKNIKIKIFCI